MAKIIRPLSFPVTAPFYNAGWSANSVTLLRIGFSLAGLILLAMPDALWRQLGVAAFYIGYLLDAVDGNLARLSDTATYFGKYLDGLADDLSILWSPLAVGIGWWLETGDGFSLALGGCLTALALFAHSSRNRASFFRVWMTEQTGALSDLDEAVFQRLSKREKGTINLLVNFQCLAPLLILLDGGPLWYVVASLIVQAPIHLLWIATVVELSYRILSRRRRSAKAVKKVS